MAEIVIKNTETFEIICNSDIGKENLKLKDAISWPKDTYLVNSAYLQIIQSLNLSEVFKNLNNGVKLLDITYNALNGMKKFSTKIFTLQSNLLQLMNVSLTTTEGFKSSTSTTIQDFITAYNYLTKEIYLNPDREKNGIALALKCFNNIIKRAKNMNKEANDLAKEFEKLRALTVNINKQIIDERDASYQEKEEIKNSLIKMQSQVDTLKIIKDELETEINEYKEEYDNLSRRAQKQDDRSYTLALTSAIFTGLGTIFGTVATAMSENNKQNATGEEGNGDNEISNKQKESEEKAEALKKEIEEINLKLEEVNRKLNANEGDKDSLIKEKDELTKQKNEKQKELDGTKEQSKVYKDALAGIGSGLNATSEKLDKLSESQSTSADHLYQRIDKIATQKANLAKEKRETLQQLATLTKSIEISTIEEEDLTVAINSLITAVGCMRLIEVYLSDIALFWANIEKFCRKLIESIMEINEYTENFVEFDDYRKFFTEETFMKIYVFNIANWVALHYVSSEYVDAFIEAREEHKSLLSEKSLDRKEHWRIARERASEMSHVFENQINELD